MTKDFMKSAGFHMKSTWNPPDFMKSMKSSGFHDEIWQISWNPADFRWNQMFQNQMQMFQQKLFWFYKVWGGFHLKSTGFHEICEISPEIHRISWNPPDFIRISWNPPDFMWNRKTFARNCNSMFSNPGARNILLINIKILFVFCFNGG